MSSFLAEYIVQKNQSDFRNYNNDYDYDRYNRSPNRYPNRRPDRSPNRYPNRRPEKKSEQMNIYKFIFTIINWIIFAVAMVLAFKCGTFGHIVAGCCCSPFYLIYRIVYPC
tara:strand:- start:879 stop:1211 length:333 start_codon:yes stop_codon:yes gene_type:complete